MLIVGGGPAGSACAIEARRLGMDVTLVDRAVFPRDKCCGDGLTAHGLRLLEDLGFRPDPHERWRTVERVALRSPSGRTVEARFDGRGVFSAVLPRVDLDAALLGLARDAGVVVHEGAAFEEVLTNDGSGVTIRCERAGELRADWLVAADGMWSPVRRSLGLSTAGYLGEWHAFRQYVDSVDGTAADTLHVWFDDDLLPGYAWSFPLGDGSVNFGFCLMRGDGEPLRDMNATWHDLFSRPHVAAALGSSAVRRDRHAAWPIPARVDRAVRSSGRVFFVGDALCATDLLTGEGIGQALETGMLAARAISSHRLPARARAAYARSIDRTFLADHRMSVALSRVLSRRAGAEAALRILGSGRRTRSLFLRWLFEDEPRAAVLTPRRWHRRFLGRDGAFVD